MVVAGAVLCVPMLKTRQWQRLVPTTVLIGVKRVVGTEWMPTRLRRELDGRIYGKELSARQVRWVIPALQRDLRKDGSPRNAHRAMEQLGHSLGAEGLAALERSLRAKDYQERQLAAEQLRRLCWDNSDKNPVLAREPSDEVLRVTVEGLQSDTITYVNGGTDNAWAGFSFLARFPERIGPFIVPGLKSFDRQQRLLCAALVAHAGLEAHYDAAAPVLIEHLAGGVISGDAILAARALSWMGAGAAEVLVRVVSSGEAQQRQLGKMLLEDLGRGSVGGFERALYRHVHGRVYGNDWEPSWYGIGGLGWTPRRLGGLANAHGE